MGALPRESERKTMRALVYKLLFLMLIVALWMAAFSDSRAHECHSMTGWLSPAFCQFKPVDAIKYSQRRLWQGVLLPLRVSPTEQTSLISRASVVSHTVISVPPPWDTAFEDAWTLPKGALRGSLMRKSIGTYLAEAEWASRGDCEQWLFGSSMELTKAATSIFERRKSHGDSSSGASGAPSPTPKSFIDDDDEYDLEEDEYSGGDPTFLDPSAWKNPKRKDMNRFVDDAQAPTEVTPSGEKPHWVPSEEEWDGFADDTAHFDDED